MKEKSFSPILAPNEAPILEEINYPLLASDKLDGIRCLFYKGQILSRSLKAIVNKELKDKFEPIRKYSEEMNLILDGEIYSPHLTFQQITSFVMTKNEVMDIPDHLNFYCFDLIGNDNYTLDFRKRLTCVEMIGELFPKIMVVVKHQPVNNPQMIEFLFEDALQNGCEGLILRDPNGYYKFGRGTLKEGLIYKVKPYTTFDAQITGVVQSTEVREGAEKTINELGRSVTSKKKDDRVAIEKASAFWVKYEDKDLKVVLAMTDEEKEEVWKNRDTYIGRWIEYKGMLIGAKDVPRHPVMVRFRGDRDK